MCVKPFCNVHILFHLYPCITIPLGIGMRSYPVHTNNFYKFLSHLGDLCITTVCVGAAVVIAQVIDAISHLYDCDRSVRILTVDTYHQSCIRESCPFIPSAFVVIRQFTQLKITLFQICDIVKEFRWCLLFKLFRERTGHSIRNQVIPILCHISAPPHVLAHAPSVENSSPKLSKCDFPFAVWCSRSGNTALPC